MSRPIFIHNIDCVTPFRHLRGVCLGLDPMSGKIVQMSRQESADSSGFELIDGTGLTVLPGFIDLHINGAGGYDFVDEDPAAIPTICETLIRHGTTSTLATVYSQDEVHYWDNLQRVADYLESASPDNIVAGIHLEGPFLNPAMHGCWKKPVFWPVDMDKWQRLHELGRGHIRIMTIAPELQGASEVFRDAARRGVVLAVGHSNAPHDVLIEAIDNGLTQVTHIFNTMPAMHHREPSVVTSAMLLDELKVHVIADGIHVHPAILRLLVRVKGSHGIALVSDAVRACGMPDGEYRLGEQHVTLKDGKATLDDGTLAGSVLTLNRAIQLMVEEVGVPLTDAARMASLNPARILGLDRQKGIIAVGKDADVVLVDEDYDVVMTVVNGRVRYRRDGIVAINR